MSLNQDFFAKYSQRKVKSVAIPGYDEPIYVRAFNSREQAAFEIRLRQFGEAKDPNAAAFTFVQVACNSEGVPLLQEEDIPKVASLDWRLVNDVVKAGMEFNEVAFAESLDDSKKS